VVCIGKFTHTHTHTLCCAFPILIPRHRVAAGTNLQNTYISTTGFARDRKHSKSYLEWTFLVKGLDPKNNSARLVANIHPTKTADPGYRTANSGPHPVLKNSC
jgi:hypothetical protein